MAVGCFRSQATFEVFFYKEQNDQNDFHGFSKSPGKRNSAITTKSKLGDFFTSSFAPRLFRSARASHVTLEHKGGKNSSGSSSLFFNIVSFL